MVEGLETVTEPVFLISPTEPPLLRSIGETSLATEAKGCDVLIVLPKLRIGVQRKTWSDLMISLDDGRLANSIPKMDMAIRMVVIEGKLVYDTDGHVVVRTRRTRGNPNGFLRLRHTRESLAGVALSLRYVHGLDIFYTETTFDTAALLVHLGSYFSKDSHNGIVGKRIYLRGARDDPWGVVSTEERKSTQRLNFMMAMGIGQKTAERLLARYNGSVPLKWALTKEELMEVPGIGEATAERLLKLLE